MAEAVQQHCAPRCGRGDGRLERPDLVLAGDAHGHGQRLELLVDGDEHARAHRADERPQQEVVLAQHDRLEVHAHVHRDEQAGERQRQRSELTAAYRRINQRRVGPRKRQCT